MSRKNGRDASTQITRSIHATLAGTIQRRYGVPGAALGALATFAGPLFAADAPGGQASTVGPAPDTNQPIEEVVVTGIKASLQKSLDVKQQSIGVVDAISAEDIGQFPDASIGQAIARMPGVTVDRSTPNAMTGVNSAGATTSTGSVSGITVRGFGSTFNESLTNGRQIASGLGQNFDFSALGSQWVNGVEVLKTPDFSLSSGDVGATINIKFLNPFDNPGLQARAYVSSTDRDTDGSWRPGGGALFSVTSADGTLGFLFDVDYSEQHTTLHHMDIVGWIGGYLNCDQYTTAPSGCTPDTTNPDGTVNRPKSPVPSWSPQDMAMYLEKAQELRKDARVALQWHPSEAVLVTLDDNFSSFDQKMDRFQYSTWFNSGALSNVVTDSNGTVTDFTSGPNPTDFNSFIADTYLVTNTPGVNVKWDVSSSLKVELDADQSISWLNPNHTFTDIDVDTGYGNSTPIGTNGYTGGVKLGGANTVPYWTALGPNSNVATNPNPGNFLGLNPFIIGSHVFPIQEQFNTDKINEVKLAVTWQTDNNRVKAGFQWLQDTFNTEELDTFDFSGSNGFWQLWSGYGSASGNYVYFCPKPTDTTQYQTQCKNQTSPPPGAIKAQAGVPLPPNLFTPVSLSNFIPGFSGNSNLPPGLLMYNPYAVAAYLVNQPPNAYFTPSAGFAPYVPGALPALGLNPGSVSKVERKNYSPFVMEQHDFDLGDMKLKADVAVRYEKTDVTVAGLQAPLLSLGLQPSDHTAYQFNLGKPQYTVVPTSYHYILPSLDLNLLVRPDLKVRFDASRTETAAPNNDLTPNTTYGGRVNALVGTGHNATLLPYLSTSFDLGLEWYYARNSYLSVDGFRKHVTQFPIQGVTYVTFPNIIDPSPYSSTYQKPVTFAVTTNFNGDAADVTGVEFTLQQMLPLGFGVQVNGTYVHTGNGFNSSDTQSATQFALPGVGNSANFIGFYQDYGFQARVTVQWQGAQFVNFGQEQNVSQFGTEPTFLAATTQVDFSASYDIDRHFSVFFEALNLNDAEFHTYGRFSNQLLNVVDYGRTFTIGARAKL
jgi:TonB-dependent receptor